MIRPVAILLVLATGGGAFAQSSDAIRESPQALQHAAATSRVNPFGGVMQRQQPPLPVPQPGGVQALVEVPGPVRREVRRVRTPGPTPGGPVKFDVHGDPLPAGAIARFGTVRLRHGGEPLALTFSPDARWLGSLSATEDGIRLWDTATGKEAARYTSPLSCAAFTRDGRVVIADGSNCKVWHPATNTARDFPDGTLPEGTTALAVHPDCTTFAAAKAMKIVLIDLQTGKVRRELKTPIGAATRVAFSRDGRWLAASGQKTGVWLWDTKTWKRARTYPQGEGDACEFAFSPDGTRIAVATNVVRVYPTDSEDELEGYNAPDEQLANPTFSADGKSVFGQLPDGGVKHIDAATGEVKDSWDAPDSDNTRPPVALASEGAMAAGTDSSGGIRIWEPKTGKGPEVERLTMLYDPGFSADGKTAACLDSISRLHQFDPLTGTPGKVIRLPIGEDVPVSWDPRSRRAAAVTNNDESEIQIIDVDTGKVTCKFPAPANTGLPTVAFCPSDRSRVVVFCPGTVAVVHPGTGRVLRTISVGMQENSQRGSFSPDGRLIAVTTAPTLGVWEVSTGKKRFAVDLPNPHDAVFSPDGRLLAVWDTSDTIVIFDLRTGTTVRRFQLPSADGSLSCAVFSPDGKRLATGDQTGVVVLWDVATAEALLVLDRHEGQVTGLQFNADGTRLLSTSHDGTALCWDLAARPQPKAAPDVGGFDDAFKLLGSADATHAQRGMEFFYRRPADAVTALAEKLPVSKPVPAERIAKLVADLDSDDFLTRTTAAKELEGVGGEAGPALRAAATSPSAEVRRSANELAAKADAPATRPDDLRVLRAVEVLEHVGTPAARDVLKAWAAGPAGHRQTVEAAAAVTRLK